MSKNSVFDQEWIDLVFEGRNKSYGAYQLRKQDSKTTLIALIAGIALMGVAVGIPAIFNTGGQTADLIDDHGGIVIHKINEPFDLPVEPKPDPVTPEPQPTAAQPAAAAPALTATTAFTPLVATSDPVIPDLPDMNDLKNTNPGATTNPGNPGGDPTSISPTGITGGTGKAPQGTGTDETTHLAVDEAPDFPGGIQKFRQEVANKFRTPDIESQSTIKVSVSFVVERDGTLSNIKVLKDPGYGAGKEAIRVLQSIKTKWKPGKIKGQPVRTAYSLPITIRIN
jgi:protein TonB